MVRNIGQHLSSLSFRTGVIVLAMCILFYAISFVQMALPISVSLKGTLWFIFFGLAKTTQYAGLINHIRNERCQANKTIF